MKEANLSYYVETLRQFGAVAIEAYPSTAYILAQFLAHRNDYLPLRCIFTHSETLLDFQRELIQDRFQCDVYDGYGQSEGVMFAAECPEHNGLHLFLEYGVIEIVDERGDAVSEGCHGRIVCTGLANYAMPLIRIENGDSSAFISGPCPCGRSLPRISPITTKSEDILVVRDGTMISPSALTHPFKPLKSIAKSQIVQESLDCLTIKVVRRPEYNESDTQALLSGLRDRVGPDMKIEIKFVEDIPLTRRGKFRWVISKVPLPFGTRMTSNLFSTTDDKH
jgi:phenylacetate-CoA ligase